MSVDAIEHQLGLFRQGIPFTVLKKPCTIEDGIERLSPTECQHLENSFRHAMDEGRVSKFVPASGAASRMFKSLLSSHANPSNQFTQPSTSSDQEHLATFLERLSDFAFFDDLSNILSQQGHQLQVLHSQGHYRPILEALLHSPGLNYAKRPKGLLQFHRYPDHTRTPIEEHLIEAAVYTKGGTNHAQVHFTISPEHQEDIHEHIESARERFRQDGLDWIVTCSLQQASSDTIAVDIYNQPFRDQQGNLLFRPAGHGALLSNLNDLHGDIVFIKNIDNVVPDHLKEETYRYKRILGGYLLTIQDTLFRYLHHLETENATGAQVEDMAEWAESTLNFTKPSDWNELDWRRRTMALRRFLNRPIRVCGMVHNTGDPGGGPFWVNHQDGTSSLQIVESSQVNPHCSEQQDIFASSTHFNPVDMVCGVRDYKGNPFDLNQFTDPNAGFISRKSYEGRELKALELPGLWNGAMAKWHTLFVEVPRRTFNPVKTVLDLLLPAHQPQDVDR